MLVVAFPGVTFAQLAPQSQEDFEQRFTGWTLQADAPDCNEGKGVAPLSFIGPGRFATRGLVEIDDRMEYVNVEGDYEYEETSANTGSLEITVDDLPIPQVLGLTFSSQATGRFTVPVFGLVACRGSFGFVESATVPPRPQTEEKIHYFPHLAVGAGWQTTIIYEPFAEFAVGQVFWAGKRSLFASPTFEILQKAQHTLSTYTHSRIFRRMAPPHVPSQQQRQGTAAFIPQKAYSVFK